jgi:uncharacterized protein (AIM24 family)
VATDLAPEHKKAQNYLGLALAQAGEFGRAREHFLLAGSDAMAEKMARAIAGEAYGRPASRPPEPPPSAPPAPAAPSASSEEDWGAQFGFEEGSVAPPPAPPVEPVEEELRFADDEGPGPAAEAAPPHAAPAAPSAVPGAEHDPFAETSAALEASAPLAPESVHAQVPAEPPEAAAFAPAEVYSEPPGAAAFAPPETLAQPPGLLSALVPAVAMPEPDASQPFLVEHGAVCVRVAGELLLRLETLVASRGALQLAPEPKRFRGRATEQPFGEGRGQMMRVSGEGTLFLESGGRVLLPVVLGEEAAYLREACVAGFQESVTFENGRVPLEDGAAGEDLDLVHLHGPGAVLLSLPGILRSVPVPDGEVVTVPIEHLVGWQGTLAPRLLGLAQGGVGVALSGEGHALIALPLRPVMG